MLESLAKKETRLDITVARVGLMKNYVSKARATDDHIVSGRLYNWINLLDRTD